MRLYITTLLIALAVIAGVIVNNLLHPTPDAIRHAEIANQLAKMERARRIGDIFWPSAAAIVILAGAGAVRWIWRRSGAPEMVRAEDGLFPILVWDRSTVRDRLTGRRRVTTHDSNRAAAPTLSITAEPDGRISAAADIPDGRWPDQIAVTQAAITVQRTQAAASGQRAPKGPTVAEIKERNGWYAHPPQPRQTAQVIQPAALPAPSQPAITLAEAVRLGSAGDVPLGQQADGPRALAVWKPSAAPHIAILGSTQQGKSSGAAYTAALTVIRQGWQVIALDPEGNGASQWKGIARWIEWASVDGHSAIHHARSIMDEAQRRGSALAAAGAANIREMDDASRPARLLVVVEEYAELRDKAASAGTIDAFDFVIGSIAQTGGKLGVHLMLISQSFRSANGTPWPATVRNNCAARLSYNQPSNDTSKTMGGLYELSQLEPGQFAYRGTVYQSWDARPQAERILAAVTPAPPRILTAQPARPVVGLPVAVSAPVSDLPVRRIRPQAETPPAQERGEGTADSGHRTPDTGQGDELTDIQRAVAEYIQRNPDAGVRSMARELGIGKTYAGELRNRYLGNPPTTPEPVFAATADAYQPPADERRPGERTFRTTSDWRGAREVLTAAEWYSEVKKLQPVEEEE